MGETSTNIATLNMDDALKVRVKDGCDVEDPCSSSPCPQHSRCRDTWDGYSCICDKGGGPRSHPAVRKPVGGGQCFGVESALGHAKQEHPRRGCGSARPEPL